MNIGCYFEGCSGVVRGQCPAYSRTNCGRYYCSEHSRDGLCDECYQEKAVDILIEKYSKIAEDIKIHQIKSDKDNLFISNGRAFILGILYIILFSILFYIPSYLIIKALPDSLFALTPSQYERLLDKESWDIWFTIGFELKQKKTYTYYHHCY